MRWIFTVALPVAMCAGLLACARAADAAPPAAAPAPASAPAGLIRLKDLSIDRAKRQVVLDAEACFDPNKPDDPLEVLLCKWGTRDYESLLRTRVEPSQLHAAFLVLGLTPGKPARMSRADTQPARLLPPEGAKLTVTLRWKGADGNLREAPARDWLLNAHDKKTQPPKDWVFVGSEIQPDGRYAADSGEEGRMISITNFATAVIDVPFESTRVYADMVFGANAKALPPMGTPVKVVITVLEGQDKAAAARLLVEVDRLGQFLVDGKVHTGDQLAAWATAYLQKHAEGMVVVRADPRATIQDLERAKEALRTGGIDDLDEQRLISRADPLPRTGEQAAAEIRRWKARFARYERMLTDPFEDVQTHLREVQQELNELDRRKAVLAEYAAALKAAAQQSKAATQKAPNPD